MNVVLYDPYVDGHHIGYAATILDHLLACDDQVTYLTWEDGPEIRRLAARFPGIAVDFVGGGAAIKGPRRSHPTRAWRGLNRAMDLAGGRAADLLHCLYIDRQELPLFLASLGSRDRFSVLATLFWPYFVAQRGDPRTVIQRLYHSANRVALRHALTMRRLDRLFVHSERIKGSIVHSLRITRLAERVVVVPDPAPVEIVPSGLEAKRLLGIDEDRKVLLFFGGLRGDKGPDVFLDALKLLEDDDRWVAVVAGRPQGIPAEEVHRAQAGLADPSRLISRLETIPDDQVSWYFGAADVVVLPYRRSFRGTSGVLQRAAAAGKPVVVADVGDIGPTVRLFKLGLVVQPESPPRLADGVRAALMQSPESVASTREKAIEYAGLHDDRILASRVRETYLHLRDEGRGRHPAG